MGSARMITVWESPMDLKNLANSGYRFQIAKGIANNPGQRPQFNVIWRSTGLAPQTQIRWGDEYALNWSADSPNPGMVVTYGGEWRPVGRGQSVKLNANGLFEPVPGGQQGVLTVASVDYAYPGTNGIHLVVGVRNQGGGFDPIFVDPRATPKGGRAQYAPTDVVQCWYDSQGQGGQVVSGPSNQSLELDCTNPTPARNMYEWWISYLTNGPGWTQSDSRPGR